MTPAEITATALEYGWACLPGRIIDGVLFRRGGAELIVYCEPSGLTVTTTVTHPVVGRSTFTRRRLTQEDLRGVFDNPRAHLNKGGKYENAGGKAALKERQQQAERNARAAADFTPAADFAPRRPHVMSGVCWCWPTEDGNVVKHNLK